MGNEKSFPFPIRKKIVRGASTERVVHEHDPALLEPFCAAARDSRREGVAAITTSCGFLAMFQRELAAAVRVPVFTSALLQVPQAAAMLPPGQVVGILTADARTLATSSLPVWASVACRWPCTAWRAPVLARFLWVIRPNSTVRRLSGNWSRSRARMLAERPDVGAIVLECTNMPPYAHAVQQASGLPVYDITTLARFVMDGLARTTFD